MTVTMIRLLIASWAFVLQGHAVPVYESELSIGDAESRAGMHLVSHKNSSWTGYSFGMCYRTNLGLLGDTLAGGVTTIQISRVFEEEEVAPLGVFFFSAVSPVPFLAFGSDGGHNNTRTTGSERLVSFVPIWFF